MTKWHSTMNNLLAQKYIVNLCVKYHLLLHLSSPFDITTITQRVHYGRYGHHLEEVLLVVLPSLPTKMAKNPSEGYVRPRPIPSNCKYKYSDFVEPVYESDKVLREEIGQLCCRATHCIRLKDTTHAENDNLYNIFALYARQDCEFMRRWLKFFMMTVYPRNFEVAGHHCLMPKGLTLDIWADSIEDGQKD